MNNPECYSIIFLRKDDDHIIIDSGNFEDTYMKWAFYRDNWSKCLHEKNPLEVVEKDLGIVTAFDPGIVYEIIIKKRDMKINNNNPYFKEMNDRGFSNTLKSHSTNSSDLLERNYNKF